VVVRALGPSLTQSGVVAALADPELQILDASGNVIASNDNWRVTQQAGFAEGGIYHALQPSNDLEAAIAVNLPPGNYRAIIDGKDLNQGIALAEIYDFSQNTTSHLSSTSTRARVAAGEDVMIGGLRIAANSNSQFVLRALGPSLSNMGVVGSLSNPVMTLYDSNGTLLRTCDNWRSDLEANDLIINGYAPPSSREPAMIVQLPEGAYTVIVQGKNGTSGTAQFEAYQLN
jgi:hypothetical protein